MPLCGAMKNKVGYRGQNAKSDKFKAILAYPGYSTTEVPTAAIKSSDVTFYWYMYNGVLVVMETREFLQCVVLCTWAFLWITVPCMIKH
jgi:hypothetical protein